MVIKNPQPNAKKPVHVILYSSRGCHFCRQAKAYFKAKQIRFMEYDVETHTKGRKDFKRLRGRGVPIVLIGRERLDGFNVKLFERLWKQAQK